MITLADVKQAQPEWFSRKNKKFFGDVGYKVLHGERTKKPFLIRSTYAWTDMFGSPRRLHYRINPLDEKLDIGCLIDKSFNSIESVKEWLQEN